MLNLSRRHSATKCGKTKRRDCTCPIWVSGSLHGKPMRKSLGIRNWEAAQKIVRDWEARINGGSQSVIDAFGYFMADCAARQLKPETIGKYRLLQREMVAVFGIRPVDSIGVHEVAEYRQSWKLSGISARKKIERMRTFFRFCAERKWSDDNPAVFLKPPKVTSVPTLPFSADEMEKIRDALKLYPDRPRGRRERVQAFVLILMHTGLRIRDVVTLTMDKISGGTLELRTQKTGQAVRIPLPDEVVRIVEGLPHMPFWSVLGLVKSAVADWQRTLSKLFKLAGVEGHAHKFRHTLAKRLLENGVSLENVAKILGNSAKIVEMHYSAWIKSRQDILESEVRRTFET
jgi:integrase/recombinase XerD